MPLNTMFEALLPLDPDTGKSRGWAILGSESHDGFNSTGAENETLTNFPVSVLFGPKKSKEYIRREYKNYLKGLESANSGKIINLSDVILFWTQNFTNNNHVWELVRPQLQPVESRDIEMVKSLGRLVKYLISINKQASDIPQSMLSRRSCELNQSQVTCGRSIDISSAEVLYIIYLASLRPDERRQMVFKDNLRVDATIKTDGDTREQLLAEVALISYTIETSDGL